MYCETYIVRPQCIRVGSSNQASVSATITAREKMNLLCAVSVGGCKHADGIQRACTKHTAWYHQTFWTRQTFWIQRTQKTSVTSEKVGVQNHRLRLVPAKHGNQHTSRPLNKSIWHCILQFMGRENVCTRHHICRLI